jgi:hypothetical protein
MSSAEQPEFWVPPTGIKVGVSPEMAALAYQLYCAAVEAARDLSLFDRQPNEQGRVMCRKGNCVLSSRKIQPAELNDVDNSLVCIRNSSPLSPSNNRGLVVSTHKSMYETCRDHPLGLETLRIAHYFTLPSSTRTPVSLPATEFHVLVDDPTAEGLSYCKTQQQDIASGFPDMDKLYRYLTILSIDALNGSS